MDQIKAGVIGDVHHVTIDMGINLPEFPKNDGGILSIMGVYALTNIRMAFSADVLEYPLKIASIGTLYKEHIDIDSVTALKYSNNKTAAITVSALTELSMRSTVYGTNGTKYSSHRLLIR